MPVAERAQELRLLYDPQPSPHFTLLVPPASAEVRAYLTRLIPSHFGPDQIEVTMPATFHMAFSLDLLHQAFPELEVAPTARTVLADLCNFSGPGER